MPTTWILAADRTKARLFSFDPDDQEFTEIADFIQPDGRRAARELSQERPPRTHDRFGHNRHAIEPQTTTRDKVAWQFARELNAMLSRGRAQNVFQDLVLIAAPRFLGMLNAQLDKPLRDRVTLEVPKRLTSAAPRAIRSYLPEKLQERAATATQL